VTGAVGRSSAPLLALASAAYLARPGRVGPHEERLFRRLNSSAGPAEPAIWSVMQMGNGLASVVAPIYVRARGGSWPAAARVGLAGAGGWQLAKAVKRGIPRERPARLLGGVALRDGDPEGRGFVSGHATVAMSVALAAAPVLSPAEGAALFVAALVVAGARVHVGAHLPLDVLGGLALGAWWGRLCAGVQVGPSEPRSAAVAGGARGEQP